MLQPENRSKGWEHGEEAVKTILKEKLDIENISLKQTNPVKKGHRKSKRSTTVVCKLQSYKHNNKVLEKDKNSKVPIFLSMKISVMKTGVIEKSSGKEHFFGLGA